MYGRSGTGHLSDPIAEKLVGWTTTEATGQPLSRVSSIISELTREVVENPAVRALQNSAVIGLANHKVLVSRRGKECPIDDSAAPIRNASGEITGCVLVFRDISERRRGQQALAASERRYRAIGESIDYGVWICDAEGKNTYTSESFLRLVGLSQNECSTFGWGAVLHPDDANATIAAWKKCVAEKGRWDREHRFKGVDGQWHSVLARGVPVLDEKGRVTSWVGINLDISRLKQVESELRDADRRKDEFLATLAHELRNPLAPLVNSLEILKMPGLTAEITTRTREMMERQVHHLVRLVDDLMDVSRVMRGKIELRLEQVELAKLVARAVETAQPMIDAQHHQLDISLPAMPLLLNVDPVRLAQVISNLLMNAGKYTEPKGRIWLTAREENGQAVMSVRDNGIGIASDILGNIFDLFVQADSSSTKSQGGLGIGLTLVRNLVEMHDGTVEAHSDGCGLGSEFIVRLPLTRTSSVAQAASVPTTSPSTGSSGLRLLVVDDNTDAASSLAMLLEIRGHEVRVANSGAAALETVATYTPDLVLLDLGMPLMDGYEVSRRMRKIPAMKQAVMAALTGWNQEEDRRKTAEAGFDHHFVKPPEPQLLENLLKELKTRLTTCSNFAKKC